MNKRTASQEHPEAVVFDMDGVLVNSEPVQFAVVQAICEENGIPFSEADIGRFLGCTSRETIETLLRRIDEETPERIRQLLGRKTELYAEQRDAIEPVEGAVEYVMDLHGSCKLGLVTSGRQTTQEPILQRLEIWDLFDVRVMAESITKGKPDPEPYETAVQDLGTMPRRTMAIEDSPKGIESVKSAGCRAVGLATFSSAELLDAAGADLVVGSYEQLREEVPLED